MKKLKNTQVPSSAQDAVCVYKYKAVKQLGVVTGFRVTNRMIFLRMRWGGGGGTNGSVDLTQNASVLCTHGLFIYIYMQ